MPSVDRKFAARLKTRVKIQSPKELEGDATQDSYGTVDRGENGWNEEGFAWCSLSQPAVSGTDQAFAVELWRRDDIATDWRFEIMSGPYAGYYLLPQSFAYDDMDPRRMTIGCVLSIMED